MQEQILSRLLKISKMPFVHGYRIGLAGSMARGKFNKRSDIDVVVDTDCISIEDMEKIKESFSDFGRSVDVLCLGLLKEEDEELDKFCVENNILINPNSVYKTILREVIWVV